MNVSLELENTLPISSPYTPRLPRNKEGRAGGLLTLILKGRESQITLPETRGCIARSRERFDKN